MERRRVAEIDGIDSSKMRQFPFSSFKLLGGLQIGLGAICLILGITDLFVYLYVANADNETLTALTIASVPIWCGLWVCMSFVCICRSLCIYLIHVMNLFDIQDFVASVSVRFFARLC